MTAAIPDSLGHLVQRRHFHLGSAPAATIPGAVHTRVADRWTLSSHPELEVTQASGPGGSLTLLGFLLDPERPADGNRQILERLVARLGRAADLPAATAGLGGRWIVIAHDGTDTLLFHDAAGLRAVYFASGDVRPGDPVPCASEPNLLARTAGLEQDPEAVAYLAARDGGDQEVYWMPGDTSPVQGVRALLPNHHLDVASGAVTRYWPSGPIPEVGFEEAVAESVRLLRGQIDAAVRRWPLSLSMTAGWDSRLMLALCREGARDVFAFTLVYPYQYSTFPDLMVPARLLPRLGMKHHRIEYPPDVDPAVRALVRRNNGANGPYYNADIQALLEAHPPGHVCLTGDVAEVVKVHYRSGEVADRDLTPLDLARLLGIGEEPFVLRAMERWLASARPAPLPLRDLFCWEQMAGRWQARIRGDFDVVHESLSPLDCRLLLTTMLGVPEARRRGPGFELTGAVIQALWPEVMALPINPPEVPTLRRRLVSAVAGLGLTRLVPRSAKDHLRRWLGRTA